jgi:hypothetical protein
VASTARTTRHIETDTVCDRKEENERVRALFIHILNFGTGLHMGVHSDMREICPHNATYGLETQKTITRPGGCRNVTTINKINACHQDRHALDEKHQRIISSFKSAIKNIKSVSIATMEWLRWAAQRVVVRVKITASDLRPISGLYSTNRGYLPATKAFYLYQSGVFIGQNEILEQNRRIFEKTQKRASFWGYFGVTFFSFSCRPRCGRRRGLLVRT